MDNKYTLDTIEDARKNATIQQLQNARQIQQNRNRFMFARIYNANTNRLAISTQAAYAAYIVLLDYFYNNDIVTAAKEKLATLDTILVDDVLHYNISEFTLNAL